jgi:hypothetical protein
VFKQAALVFSSNSVKAISMTNNVNAKVMFANTLSSRLIEACNKTGYYKVANKKDNLFIEIKTKYGACVSSEENLFSFKEKIKDSIKNLFKDSYTGDMVFSFHESNIEKLFNKLEGLNQEEKYLDSVVKNIFLDSFTMEDFKNSCLGFVENSSQKECIENGFDFYYKGSKNKFVNLVGDIVDILNESISQEGNLL